MLFLSELGEGEDPGKLRGGHQNVCYGAGLEFCLQYLLDKNFVIHSVSESAKRKAFALGWPMYSKNAFSGNVEIPYDGIEAVSHNDVIGDISPGVRDIARSYLERHSLWKKCKDNPGSLRMEKTPEMIGRWERGGPNELISRRIAPLLIG
jgi:hypothetical protein